MTISQLNTQLTQALKNYIKSSGHNETGALYGSIRFTCTDNNGLKINFKTMNYIQYLDDGEFINSFFGLSSTNDIISEYLVSKLVTTLTQNPS